MKKKPMKNQGGKGDVRTSPRVGSGTFTDWPGGTTNQQDSKQTNRRKTKVLSLMGVMCGRNARRRTADKETSTHANTPGRLRARSGSKLPSATGPLRALGMVDCHGQGAWDCLRGAVRDRVPPISIITQQSDSQYQFSKNMILHTIFFKNMNKYEE